MNHNYIWDLRLHICLKYGVRGGGERKITVLQIRFVYLIRPDNLNVISNHFNLLLEYF